MAAEIPLFLTIGNGAPVKIGHATVEIQPTGPGILTTVDVAAALRETADAMDARTREADDAPAG